jgi:hypothetical protein
MVKKGLRNRGAEPSPGFRQAFLGMHRTAQKTPLAPQQFYAPEDIKIETALRHFGEHIGFLADSGGETGQPLD